MHPAIGHHLCISQFITSRLQHEQLCPSITLSRSGSAQLGSRAPCLHQDTSAAMACSLHSRRRNLGRSQGRRSGNAIARADAAAVDIGQHSCRSRGSEGSQEALSSSEDNSPVSFVMCRIPGDGSCLFRALVQGQHQLQRGQRLCQTGRHHTCMTHMGAVALVAPQADAEPCCTPAQP